MSAALQPGDVLLYKPSGFWGHWIAVKTWSHLAHVEVYDGRGWSVASREGYGVGRYETRREGLALVLRPLVFNKHAARAWFKTVDGQPYDYLGLISFYYAKLQGNRNWRQFCSEFATRYLRAGKCDPFRGYNADGIAPSEFVKSTMLDLIWEQGTLPEMA